jgi:hypothetical protein
VIYSIFQIKTDVDKIKSTTGDGTQEGSGSQSAKRIRI